MNNFLSARGKVHTGKQLLDNDLAVLSFTTKLLKVLHKQVAALYQFDILILYFFLLYSYFRLYAVVAFMQNVTQPRSTIGVFLTINNADGIFPHQLRLLADNGTAHGLIRKLLLPLLP